MRRRDFLAAGAGVALRPASAAEPALDFIHLSDTHVIYQPGIDPRLIAMRKMFLPTIDSLPKALAQWERSRRAELVLLTGDLIDVFSFLGADGGVVEGQVEAMARILAESPLPVYACLGNHDVQHYGVWQGKLLADQSVVGKARAQWIRQVPCFAQGVYYRFQRTVGETRYQFVLLDNGFYGHRPPFAPKRTPQHTLGIGQMDWLYGVAQAAADDPLVIGLHIPPTPGVWAELKEILGQRKRPMLLFTGHYHDRNHVTKAPDFGAPLFHIATPGYCDNPDHWRHVRLLANRVEVSSPGPAGATIQTIALAA